jgi:transposase
MTMLKGLTEYIVDDEKPKRGRPPIPKSDLVFQMIQKVYEGRSARRFIGDVRETFRSGRIGKVPHFNSIINGMKDAKMTPILHGLIEISSRPLRELPGDFVFAADSSGFSASPHYRWLENKPGAVKQREGEDAEQFEIRTRRVWTKVHLMCSTRTHVVTGVVIKNRDASDVQQLKALIEQTDPNFNIQELCADKAYGAIYNYQQCADLGIDPYIPFKTNQNGSAASRTGSKWNTAGGRLWNNCFHRFHLHVEEFEQHYHQRSNVESVFSMIKRKFGPSVFSKSETGMINEVLCKIILHNIWCVIEAMYTLGIDPSELEPTRPPKPRLQVIQGGLQ